MRGAKTILVVIAALAVSGGEAFSERTKVGLKKAAAATVVATAALMLPLTTPPAQGAELVAPWAMMISQQTAAAGEVDLPKVEVSREQQASLDRAAAAKLAAMKEPVSQDTFTTEIGLLKDCFTTEFGQLRTEVRMVTYTVLATTIGGPFVQGDKKMVEVAKSAADANSTIEVAAAETENKIKIAAAEAQNKIAVIMAEVQLEKARTMRSEGR